MRYFVTGTDTDVGKSVGAAWLMLQLGARYWKPVQSGVPRDMDGVKGMTGLGEDRFLPSVYELSEPLSPHEAARRDGVRIELEKLRLPEVDGPLVVEGAGGLMVPINEEAYVMDLIEQLGLPSVLVCRSGLGTINHTLLSLEAMRSRGLEVAGLIISGTKNPHNREALEVYGKVPVIAEIGQLDRVDAKSLLAIEPEISLL